MQECDHGVPCGPRHRRPVAAEPRRTRTDRSRTRAVATLAAMLAGAAVTATGVAQAQPTVPPGSTYVALGSSAAAGPVLAPVVHSGCGRSGVNYPSRVAAQLGLNLVDVTCSGATTASVLSTPQPLPDGTTNPVQIEAVTPETALVTVTVGGNDLRYIGGMTLDSCAVASAIPGRALPAVCSNVTGPSTYVPTDADVAGVENRLVAVADGIRARAPQARVVFVDYLPVLDPADPLCPAVPLTPDQWLTMSYTASALAGATDRAAVRSGATLVRASAAGVGHTPCSPEPWMSGFSDPESGDGPVPYHPTHAGMSAVAGEVVRALA